MGRLIESKHVIQNFKLSKNSFKGSNGNTGAEKIRKESIWEEIIKYARDIY